MTSPAVGRSLELYYIDGRPDGMLTAEMFNWTGHVLMTPRTQLSDALARRESAYAGVYLLFGEHKGEACAYIGEGEDISSRIKSHDVNKDWWTSAILVTTAGNKLNKAHARYLEARLIEEARKIARTPLDNGTSPAVPGLSEADIAKMEAFLENLLVVLPALRVDTFIERARPGIRPATSLPFAQPSPAQAAFVEWADTREVRFVLHHKKQALTAYASIQGGEFVVESGSTASLGWSINDKSPGSYGKLHDELKRAGVLVVENGKCRFAESYAFSSPSAAGSVVNGFSTNGATAWRTVDTNETYKEWEARKLASAKGPRPTKTFGGDDEIQLLRESLQINKGYVCRTKFDWSEDLMKGNWATIPPDLNFADSIDFGYILDGYELWRRLGRDKDDMPSFYGSALVQARASGRWEGNIVHLWLLLFFAHRACAWDPEGTARDMRTLDRLPPALREQVQDLPLFLLTPKVG